MTNLIKTGIDEIDRYEIIKKGEVTLFVYNGKFAILSPDLITISLFKNLILNKEEPIAIINWLENQEKLRKYILDIAKVLDTSSYSWEKLLENGFYNVPFLNLLVTNKIYKIKELKLELKRLQKLPQVLIFMTSKKGIDYSIIEVQKLAKTLNVAIVYFIQPSLPDKFGNLIDRELYQPEYKDLNKKATLSFKKNSTKLLNLCENIVFMEDEFYDNELKGTGLLKLQVVKNTNNNSGCIFTLPSNVIKLHSIF